MQSTNTIEKFRYELHELLPKRPAATMNLIDALSSEGHRYKSIVQLSQSCSFTRGYSSVCDAISANATDFKSEVFVEKLSQLLHQSMDAHSRRYYGLDVTPQPRAYAKKLADKTIVHSPNPAPGNRPICIGHSYSIIAGLSPTRDDHWVAPLDVARVPSDQKGHEFGMNQMKKLMAYTCDDTELKVSVGDSLYGTNECRKTATMDDNQVHIFRLRISRNVFTPVVEQKNKGRRREYGNKLKLKNTSGWPKEDAPYSFEFTSAKGQLYTVKLKRWNDLLIRGTREFHSANHPIDVIQADVQDADGNSIYKRPLWIGILGKRKSEIKIQEAYEVYCSRYDLEHYFRFGKNNLLMDKYQTPDVDYEEVWWRLCTIAYVQLYHGRELVEAMPNPWERYLPAFKEMATSLATPTQTQRGFQKLLGVISTPAAACVKRGNPKGRRPGETPVAKRSNHEVIFKGKGAKSQSKSDHGGSENQTKNSNPEKMKKLVDRVIKQLQESGFSPQDFINLLQSV